MARLRLIRMRRVELLLTAAELRIERVTMPRSATLYVNANRVGLQIKACRRWCAIDGHLRHTISGGNLIRAAVRNRVSPHTPVRRFDWVERW